MSDMTNIIQLRPVKGEGTLAEPYRATVDEVHELCREQWKIARVAHLRAQAAANSPGVLRLHNGGLLPGEPGKSRDLTPAMLSGLRRELLAIAERATEAAEALATMEKALRRE